MLGSSSGRRTFKKSFSGCHECRRRKVKCDEVHPICGRCMRHFKNPTPCDWGNVGNGEGSRAHRSSLASRSNRSALLSRPSSQSLSPKTQSPIGATKLNFSLRLFYNYITIVAPKLPQSHNPNVKAMWLCDAPQYAFEYDYLLNSILALSALYLHLTVAPDDAGLLKTARIYFDACLRSFQDHDVDDLNSSNAEAKLITAVTLPLLAKLERPNIGRDPKHPIEPYRMPLMMFHMIRALHKLTARTGRWLDDTNVKVFLNVNGVKGADKLPHKIFLREQEKTNMMNILTGLGPDSEEAEIYTGPVRYLLELQEVATRGDALPRFQRRVAKFIYFMSDEFMKLLEQHDPRALVIIAHLLAFAKNVGTWYVGGSFSANYEVNGVLSLLPDGWKPLMDWPLYIVNRLEYPAYSQSIPHF